MTIGDRIKKIRKEGKLSQAELGWCIDPSASKASAESKIKRFKVNGQEPTIGELSIIAEKTGSNLKWLLTGEGEGKTVSESTSNELTMLLIKEQSRRMDDMQSRIEAQAKALSRYADHVGHLTEKVQEVWKAIETKDINLTTLNASITEITMRLLDIREDMNRAADHKDVTLLKKAVGD